MKQGWGARLTRRGAWLQCAAIWLVFAAARAWLLPAAPGHAATALSALAVLALGWVCVRRLHDRSHSGWALLWAVAPVAGALWLFWQIGCRAGVPHENRWGPDPRAPHGDFLKVE
jgi:uncharacterized membrane protein YhaH (DUF805 family)